MAHFAASAGLSWRRRRRQRQRQQTEGRTAVGRVVGVRTDLGRLPDGFHHRARLVQQGEVGPANVTGQHGGAGRVQGDRQEARARRIVRPQVPAPRAGRVVRHPAPEHRQHA